jgi:hypothetical protein
MKHSLMSWIGRTARPRKARSASAAAPRARLQIDSLEDRLLLATAVLPVPPAGAPAKALVQVASPAAAVTTTLVKPVTTTDTMIVVKSLAGFPKDFPFYIRIDGEIMSVNFSEGADGVNNIYVNRGKNGTFARAHAAGALVELVDMSQEQAPSSPSPLKAKAVSSTRVTLSWKAADRAQGYRVYWQNGKAWQLIGTVGASATSVDVTGLKAGSVNSFYVEAYNTHGTNDSNVVTWGTAPGSPAPLQVQRLTRSSFVLSWAAAAGAKGYRVYASTGKAWVLAATYNASVTATGTNPGKVSPHTTYTFLVEAFNDYGVTDSNVLTFTTPS